MPIASVSPRLTVVGSTNWDICLFLPKLPEPGETVGGGELKGFLGGKGANQAIAARHAGADVHFVTCLGDDDVAQGVAGKLTAFGLPPAGIETAAQCATGTACIFIDQQAENCIGLTPGANQYLDVERVENHRDRIASSDMLLVQLEIPMPSVLKAVDIAHEAGVPVILNPAPVSTLDKALLSKVDLLTPNLSELRTLTGMALLHQDEIIVAAHQLITRGVGQVLVTLGAKGAFWISRDRQQYFAPYPVNAVDTTGAGDCFNGYLAAGLAAGMLRQLRLTSGGGRQNGAVGLCCLDTDYCSEAVKQACAAAALSVTREGAVTSMPTTEEVDNFLSAQAEVV